MHLCPYIPCAGIVHGVPYIDIVIPDAAPQPMPALVVPHRILHSYDFRENVGFPPLSLIWILPLTVAVWSISLAFASRRYQ